MIAIGFIVIALAGMFTVTVLCEPKNRRPCPHRHDVCGNKPCFIYPDGGEA